MDGQWGHWTSWSKCTKKCGHGKNIRTRVCDSPFPSSNGGRACVGNDAEEKDCYLGSCIGKFTTYVFM